MDSPPNYQTDGTTHEILTLRNENDILNKTIEHLHEMLREKAELITTQSSETEILKSRLFQTEFENKNLILEKMKLKNELSAQMTAVTSPDYSREQESRQRQHNDTQVSFGDGLADNLV